MFSVGNTLYAKGPLLDEGGRSGGFDFLNTFLNPWVYQPPYTLLDPGSSSGKESGGFGISDSYIFPSLPGYRLSDTPVDAGPSSGGGSGGFGLSNSYTPLSLAGYQPPYALLDPGPSSGGGDGFWGDVQRFLQSLAGLSSLIDPYILTEQERMQLEIQRRLAEVERARAEAEARRASVQVQPAVPAWVWVAVVGLVVVALVLLLKE